MGKLAGPLVADQQVVDLGAAEVGASTQADVTLTNTGQAPLAVSGLALAGTDAADFAVAAGGDACAATTLQPGGSCTVTVTFSPLAVGARAGTLVVTHDGLNAPFSVQLQGQGNAPTGAPALSVQGGTSRDFGRLGVGRTSVPQQVVVSNQGGSAPLSVATALGGDAAGDFSVAPGSCTQPVPADAQCALEVTFTPAASGPRDATLTVSGDGSEPASVELQLRGTGFEGRAAVSPAVDADGFPRWYQDDDGVRLEQCLEQGTGRCVLLADPGFDPAQPISFPDNYPEESFYAIADSDLVGTPGCQGTDPGTALLRLALEATFANGTPTAGDQVTFGRIRVRVTSGLCPGETYTFTTPYGDLTGTADVDGALRITQDVGCGAAPCAFDEALGSPVLGGFVRWAPGVGAAAPQGYLGDGVSFHRVVGATHSVGGVPANWFEIHDSSGASVGRTERFLVSGKEVAAFSSSPVDFGDQAAGSSSAPRTVSFTNDASTASPVASVDVVGADAAAFTAGTDTCSATDVPSGSSCTVDVAFTPPTTGAMTAQVRLVAADGRVLGAAELTGNGVGAPVLTVRALRGFGTQPAGSVTTVTVPVTNDGTTDLVVHGLDVTGDPDFSAALGTCSAPVAPGRSCRIEATFSPRAPFTRKEAVVAFASNAGGAPTLTLRGWVGADPNGTAGLTPSTAVRGFGVQPAGSTVTRQVAVTNTGSADLVVQGLALAGDPDFSGGPGTCATPVAPGRRCFVDVTFSPRAPFTGKEAVVSFVSNAPDAPTLTLRGSVGPDPNGTSEVAPAIDLRSFGRQSVGSTTTRTVVITNTGTANLVVTGVRTTGDPDFSADLGTCGVVAPGRRCAVAVTFAPLVLGLKAGTLSFTSNAVNDPTVALQGRAVAAG